MATNTHSIKYMLLMSTLKIYILNAEHHDIAALQVS